MRYENTYRRLKKLFQPLIPQGISRVILEHKIEEAITAILRILERLGSMSWADVALEPVKSRVDAVARLILEGELPDGQKLDKAETHIFIRSMNRLMNEPRYVEIAQRIAPLWRDNPPKSSDFMTDAGLALLESMENKLLKSRENGTGKVS